MPSAFNQSDRISFDALVDTVFERASEGTNARLSVVGEDIPGLVVALEEVISDCIELGDFTQLLLVDRTFQRHILFLYSVST